MSSREANKITWKLFPFAQLMENMEVYPLSLIKLGDFNISEINWSAGAFIRIYVVIINPTYLVIIRDELWKHTLWPLIWNDFNEGSQMRGHKECLHF